MSHNVNGDVKLFQFVLIVFDLPLAGRDTPESYAASADLTTSEGLRSAKEAASNDKAGKFKDAGFDWSASAYSFKRAVVYNTLLGDTKATARSLANRIKSLQQGCKSNCGVVVYIYQIAKCFIAQWPCHHEALCGIFRCIGQ